MYRECFHQLQVMDSKLGNLSLTDLQLLCALEYYCLPNLWSMLHFSLKTSITITE